MIDHKGELTLCPFREDGAAFAFCYKDDKCPCYKREETDSYVNEYCYRDNIAYAYHKEK